MYLLSLMILLGTVFSQVIPKLPPKPIPQKSKLAVTPLVRTPFDMKNIKQVVIWGHKLHSHTHSYIHWAFHRTFEYLGYKTYWLDDDDTSADTIDFSNTLFITEGQVDNNIPLRYDCFYVLHYCRNPKYQPLFEYHRAMRLEAYTDTRIENRPNLVKVEECIYYDLSDHTLFIPWATDLLPHEIDKVKENLPNQLANRKKIIYWVGTIGRQLYGNIKEINSFKIACKKNKIAFEQRGGNVSMEEHRNLIQKSYMAPAIVGTWQQKHGYVPCRAFKDISYGHMILTNSLRTYELFEKKIVYNPSTMELFFDAQKRLETVTIDEIYELMDIVKNKHTYINRIDTICMFADLIGKQATQASQERLLL